MQLSEPEPLSLRCTVSTAHGRRGVILVYSAKARAELEGLS